MPWVCGTSVVRCAIHPPSWLPHSRHDGLPAEHWELPGASTLGPGPLAAGARGARAAEGRCGPDRPGRSLALSRRARPRRCLAALVAQGSWWFSGRGRRVAVPPSRGRGDSGGEGTTARAAARAAAGRSPGWERSGALTCGGAGLMLPLYCGDSRRAHGRSPAQTTPPLHRTPDDGCSWLLGCRRGSSVGERSLGGDWTPTAPGAGWSCHPLAGAGPRRGWVRSRVGVGAKRRGSAAGAAPWKVAAVSRETQGGFDETGRRAGGAARGT